MGLHAVRLVLLTIIVTVQLINGLKIISLTMKDEGKEKTAEASVPVTHACSKSAFNKCEDTFQRHVQAVAQFKDDEDKQDLWCQVLQSHKSCMDEALDNCLPEHPIRSEKIQKYLQEVVRRGCTHEGKPIDNGCAKHIRQRREADPSTENKSIFDLAAECMKHNSELDPALAQLMALLQNLTKSIRHLYKELPDQ